MADAMLIEMGRLRTLLVAAQAELLTSGDTPAALALITDALATLNPRRDPEARHPSVDQDAVRAAVQAAHDSLIAAGIGNPVEVLIVQSHDDTGGTTGRSLASSAANPDDLLRVCLRSIEREQTARKQARERGRHQREAKADMKLTPDPERLADARRRAAFSAEHSPERSNRDARSILAFDVLGEFVEEIYAGSREQIAWALLYLEERTDLRPHHQRLREDAWKKIHDDAEHAEWERLGLRR